MILERLGAKHSGVRVEVHKDPAYGWHPTVYASPTHAHTIQKAAEAIAKELRTKYDLKA
jgi:hypothetical protein